MGNNCKATVRGERVAASIKHRTTGNPSLHPLGENLVTVLEPKTMSTNKPEVRAHFGEKKKKNPD